MGALTKCSKVLHNKFGKWRPFAKNLIEYNNNNNWIILIIKRSSHWYWVYWAKHWFWNNENAIDYRWSGGQDEDEKVLIWLTSLKITKST